MNVIFLSRREGRARQLNLAHPLTLSLVGALALAVFAVVVTVTVTRVLPGFALLFASLGWLAVAVGAYLALWGRRRGILSSRSG